MTMETKQEIFERYQKEYFKARAKKRGGKERCGEILDIVCDISKMHRKSAIRSFTALQIKDSSIEEKRGRDLYYTPDVTAALKDIWDAGNSLCGELLHPLIIDVPVLWDIMRAQWNKGQVATQESLAYIKSILPWNMLEVHPDTGSEFINWHMKGWCDTKKIDMSRSRPNHSNDNMHVEERNGHVIRKYIGYIRLDCKEAVLALNDVYDVLCPYLNHFITSRRVVEKFEVNGKWKKKYEKVAKTPYQRVLESEHVSNEVKEKLRTEHAKLNPLVMKKEIDRRRKVLYDVQRKHGTTEF